MNKTDIAKAFGLLTLGIALTALIVGAIMAGPPAIGMPLTILFSVVIFVVITLDIAKDIAEIRKSTEGR